MHTRSRNTYAPHGISLQPNIPSRREKVRIAYNGLLPQSGATQVYAHVGYTNRWESNNWYNVYDYQMTKTHTGFEVTVPVASADTLKVCFKDAANNWDNNSGRNYTFEIAH